MSWFGLTSYGTAGVVYGVISLLLLTSHPGTRRAMWLIAAMAGSAVWGLAIVAVLRTDTALFPPVLALDAIHVFLWTGFICSLLAADPASSRNRWLLGLSALVGAWVVLFALGAVPPTFGVRTVFPALLGQSLLGFLAVEQVFRNAREEQRRSLLFLCLAVGGVFAIDLFVYADATLLGGVMPFTWESRGLLNVLVAPLVLVAIKRHADWERGLFVSRQVTFYTASLMGVGLYLVAMAIVGYGLHQFGGQWGQALQFVFLVAALSVLVIVLLSANIKRRFRVFLVKHFYRNKYDYRHEWLRLTEILATGKDRIAEKALEGMMRVLDAERGALWITRDGQRYEWAASLGESGGPETTYRADHPLVAFLRATRWVVDSEEYAREPDLYASAFGHPDSGVLPRRAIVVPLERQGSVEGFIILGRPSRLGSLNFEDHDVLKTAGRQIAVFLARHLAEEALSATRQFEAMNKLSTFLMHDLKNVIAQQQLVVANAERFRHRPEFIDDAISTMRSGLARLKRVLEQLNADAAMQTRGGRADVSKALMEVRSRCSDRSPVPHVQASPTSIWVAIDREQIISALMHLVRNAQDATPANGRIDIEVVQRDTVVEISVEDTGCGMDEVFLRDRLFRPFDSTKGAQGMGIGAYQVRDIVHAAGGEIEVQSKVGAGTTFKLKLLRAPDPMTVSVGEPAV
jgi:putative PEP-CTERM system histidine kinase